MWSLYGSYIFTGTAAPTVLLNSQPLCVSQIADPPQISAQIPALRDSDAKAKVCPHWFTASNTTSRSAWNFSSTHLAIRSRFAADSQQPGVRWSRAESWWISHGESMTWKKLDDGWPESVEEQGLLLLVWRRNFRNDLWKMCYRQSRRGVSRQDSKKCKTIVCIADTLLHTYIFTHKSF